jgi:hypothetical protein
MTALTLARYSPLDRVTDQVARLAALELNLNSTTPNAFLLHNYNAGSVKKKRRITGTGLEN